MRSFNLRDWINSIPHTKVNEEAQELLRKSSLQYIHRLTKWQKFILFHHTLRSAHINKLLKTGLYDGYTRGLDWAEDFLSHIEENGLQDDPHAYPFYHLGNLDVANIIRYGNDLDQKYNIIRYMMYQYIVQLQTILLGAPILEQDTYVYKVTSGVYPNLPKNIKCNNPQLNCPTVPVKQLTFNSTTMNKRWNFSSFYDKTEACCYYIIYIPKGNRILHLSEHIHGFPYQDEVLLPFSAVFNVLHNERHIHTIDIPRRMDIQNRPFTMGPVTIIDPDRMDEMVTRDLEVTTYLVTYTPPTGIDCVVTTSGIINPIPEQCILNRNTFRYNQNNFGYISGKFNDNVPLITTYIQYIPSFLSFATPKDLVVFEFENVLGIPITQAWESGVIPYNKDIPPTTMVPGGGLAGLAPLSKTLRMITMVGLDQNQIPEVANLLKQNNLNITTVGTVLPNRSLTFSEALAIIYQTYGGDRLFYVGSDPARLNGVNIPNVDIYPYYVNILKTAVSVTPENLRNANTEQYRNK